MITRDNWLSVCKVVCKAQNVNSMVVAEEIEDIAELEKKALARLDTIPPQFWQGVYIGTSGGKDSVAVYHLMSKSKFYFGNVLHTPKPGVTHPKTVEFLYSRPYPIHYHPKEIPLPGWMETQVDGSRAKEYNRTDGRSTDVVVGGVSVSRENMPLYIRNGLFGRNFVFPIFDWTDEQVWAYIFANDIEYSDEYLEETEV